MPFTIWCAGRFLDDYPAALWATVSGYGDVDTTCAIVGGIVALRVGAEGIPLSWRAARARLGNGGLSGSSARVCCALCAWAAAYRAVDLALTTHQ